MILKAKSLLNKQKHCELNMHVAPAADEFASPLLIDDESDAPASCAAGTEIAAAGTGIICTTCTSTSFVFQNMGYQIK